jgi:hypothetical protein
MYLLALLYEVYLMPRGKKAGPPIMPFDGPSANEQQLSIEELPDEVSPANPMHSRPREPRERDAAAIKRMSLTLNPDNTIAWDRLRESNRKEVERIITGWMHDPKMLSAMGIEKPIVEVFPADWCVRIYDAAAQIEIALAPKMLGVSHEVAVAAFSFSAEEKAMLAKPTADVVNKYAPAFLARFKEEIGLVMILIPLTAAKFQLAKQLSEAEREHKGHLHAVPSAAETMERTN